MVDVKGFLFDNKKWIILVGLATGVLSLLDFLPKEIGPVGSYTNYVYIGLIVLAGYVYYTFHWNFYGKKPVSYEKKTPVRNLNRTKGVVSSAGGRTNKVFDNFHRDD